MGWRPVVGVIPFSTKTGNHRSVRRALLSGAVGANPVPDRWLLIGARTGLCVATCSKPTGLNFLNFCRPWFCSLDSTGRRLIRLCFWRITCGSASAYCPTTGWKRTHCRLTRPDADGTFAVCFLEGEGRVVSGRHSW